MIAIAITLIVLASLRAYQACQDHGKLKGWGSPTSFFGSKQWMRKLSPFSSGANIPRFPGSTTWLVFLTDGYHLFQFLERPVMLIALPLLVISARPEWWVYGAMWGFYVLVFAIVYKILQK